jgi:hypothetical protein
MKIAFGLVAAKTSEQISLKLFFAQEQPIVADSSNLKAMHFMLMEDTLVNVEASSLVTDLPKVTLYPHKTDTKRYTLNKEHRNQLCLYVFKSKLCNSYNCSYITKGIFKKCFIVSVCLVI